MKQVLIKQGQVVVEEVPVPTIEAGTVLVQVRQSCISIGTELSGLRASGEPLWKKAIRYPGVMAELRKARALVFPSLLYETDGLSVVEAAALGIPAIVSDVSAARASIVDGVTGLLFKAGDPKDLAEKMSALRDDETGTRMGRAAHAHYWKNPRTLERHVQELEHTYEQVLAC